MRGSLPILTVPIPQTSQRGGRPVSEGGTGISNNRLSNKRLNSTMMVADCILIVDGKSVRLRGRAAYLPPASIFCRQIDAGRASKQHTVRRKLATPARDHTATPPVESGRNQFVRRAEMSSTNGHTTSMQAALDAIEAAASRPSPADRFNIDREGPAKRAVKLRALQQRFQKLNEYCDEAAAEIRASLERSPR